MNAICQFQRSRIQLTRAGVTIAPTLVPELKIPVAIARSFFGNHSVIALIDAGKLPDSPIPRLTRAAANCSTDPAAAWAIAERLQNNTASENPARVPSRSINVPTTSDPTP